MTCPDCTQAATIWHWGGYRASCEGCKVRALARSPQPVRGLYYASLRAAGGDEATVHATKVAIGHEFGRIKALRGQQTSGG